MNSPFKFAFDRAAGHQIWDKSGRCYQDLTSGWNVVNAGWGNADITSEWRRCGDDKIFKPSWCEDEYVLRLRSTLKNLAPGYTPIHSCSGSEAIDNALKISRMVTGRGRVATLCSAYHGSGTGAALANGRSEEHLDPLGLANNTDVLSLAELERHEPLSRSRLSDLAAIVFETVQTNAGCYALGGRHFQALEKYAHSTGALLVCDEIGTGINRVAGPISCFTLGIRPDIVVLGKALTNGIYPLSTCLVRDELLSFVQREAMESTYGGASSGCAAALATLAWHSAHDLSCYVSELQKQLVSLLLPMIKQNGIVAGLHGFGGEYALHLDWNYGLSVGMTPRKLLASLLEAGIFAALSPVDCHLMITPPLVISATELDQLMNRVGEVLDAI